jgi:hypothetical protein
VVSNMCEQLQDWAAKVGQAKRTDQLVLLPKVCSTSLSVSLHSPFASTDMSCTLDPPP